jgi:hypothetical protein
VWTDDLVFSAHTLGAWDTESGLVNWGGFIHLETLYQDLAKIVARWGLPEDVARPSVHANRTVSPEYKHWSDYYKETCAGAKAMCRQDGCGVCAIRVRQEATTLGYGFHR